MFSRRWFRRSLVKLGSARGLRSPKADEHAQSIMGADRALASVADRQAAPARNAPPRGMDQGRLKPTVVRPVLPLAFAAGGSLSTARSAATPTEPVGCCSTYGDCRERFTQEACVNEGEFQGWTSTWHAAECTPQDVSPAPDLILPAEL